MVKVVWSYRATNQLERVVKYIREEQGLAYAKTVVERILSSTRNLESTPRIGQIEPLLEHKKSEYRYLVVWSYKVIYKVAKDRVVISRIFHTSQDPNRLKGV
jgi:plasmid stabilization system protein ParE